MNLRVLLVGVVMVLLAAACASDGESTASPATEPSPPTPTSAVTDPTPAPTAIPEPSPTPAPAPTSEPAPNPTSSPTATPEPVADDARASGCGGPAEPGTSTVTFMSEGRTRSYELILPSGYDPAVPTPLVLNWHGLGSTGIEQNAFSGYPVIADRETVIVAAPNGIPAPGDNRTSWELSDDADPTRDDVLFANELLDHLTATLCVDDERVYSTGMSNGGYFSARLVCEMAERIAAAASVGGLYHPDDCQPSRPVPYIGFHGTEDEVVPYDGGGTSSLLPEGTTLELFEASIPSEFAEFTEDFGCVGSTADRRTAIRDESIEFGPDVSVFDYTGCEVEMTFYKITNGGHTWPGSPISLLISQGAGLGVTTDDIVATEVSWAFFDRHSLNG